MCDKYTLFMSVLIIFDKNAIEELEQTWGNSRKFSSSRHGFNVPVTPKYHPALYDTSFFWNDDA